jgi:hypothetical protein
LKWNGKHQLLFYAGDVYILGGNLHTIEKKAQNLVVASKEMGIKVDADKPKYMITSRDQNSRRSHNVTLTIDPLQDWKSSNIW